MCLSITSIQPIHLSTYLVLYRSLLAHSCTWMQVRLPETQAFEASCCFKRIRVVLRLTALASGFGVGFPAALKLECLGLQTSTITRQRNSACHGGPTVPLELRASGTRSVNSWAAGPSQAAVA